MTMKNFLLLLCCTSGVIAIVAAVMCSRIDDVERMMSGIEAAIFLGATVATFVLLFAYLLVGTHAETSAVADVIEDLANRKLTSVAEPSPGRMLESLAGFSLLKKGHSRHVLYGRRGPFHNIETSMGILRYSYQGESRTRSRDIPIVWAKGIPPRQQELLPNDRGQSESDSGTNDVYRIFADHPGLTCEIVNDVLFLFFVRNAYQEFIRVCSHPMQSYSEHVRCDLDTSFSVLQLLSRGLDR